MKLSRVKHLSSDQFTPLQSRRVCAVMSYAIAMIEMSEPVKPCEENSGL